MRQIWNNGLLGQWIHGFQRMRKVCACALLAGGSLLACAADPLTGSPGDARADPPALAGRVAEVTGSAWYLDASNNAWAQLIRNQTVAEGDRLRADPNARVSLRIGSTNVWLNGGADLEILQMDDAGVQLRLGAGAMGLGLRSAEIAREYQVQTREGQLFPDESGLYRIEQLAQGTRAQTLQGRLRFESERSGALQRAWLREGEQAEFSWVNGPRTEHQALLRDSFANGLLAQWGRDDNLAAQQYVSPEMTGVEDLDRNGVWQQAPEYGTVWIPTQVAPGWEPYSDGRWQWTVQWGWSWIDNAPWGFAPFHYGRWVVWRGRWCWTPGHYVGRPVYAACTRDMAEFTVFLGRL